MELPGKVALVTGAGRRVGRALAIALAEGGARVAVHYRNSEQDARETVESIRSLGGEAQAFQADLSDVDQVRRLASEVESGMGAYRVLINSASAFTTGTLAETTVEQWDGYMAVNMRAAFLLAQSMAESLPEGEPGKIVNMNDWRTARAKRFAYGVSKSALSGLTRSLAVAMAPDVQVNELALGAILPPADGPQDIPREQVQMDLGPADRMGSLNEVTRAALFLIGNDFITGETLHVDGGRHIR